MTFLAPIGLLALLALPLIVILHLIGERQQRQVVPSLLLWRGIPIRPDGARWKVLPISLLLLLHLLAALLFGLALARPQLAGLPSDGARHTAVLIDRSTSMATREGTRRRIDLAFDRARSLIAELRPGDRITLVGVGPQAVILAEGGAADGALLNAALERVAVGGVGADFDAALALAEAALDGNATRRIIALSDGAIPALTPRRVGVPFEWQTIGSDHANRAIVTFAARPWGGKLQVYARLANYGGPEFSTTLRLYGDGQLIGTDIIPFASDGEHELTWSLPASIGELRAELDGSDALPDDDQAYLSMHATRVVEVLLVSAQPQITQRALAAIPGLQVTVVDTIAYDSAQSATVGLTIFDDYLPEEWPQGAVLLVNPPAGSTLLNISEEAPRPVVSDSLVQRAGLLDGLSFSGVTFGEVRPLVALPAGIIPLLSSQSQTLDDQGNIALVDLPLIMRGQIEGHEIALWAFDLNRTNLPARLAFPLLMARTIRDLTASPPPASIALGTTVVLRVDPRADTVAVIGPDAERDLVARSAAAGLEGFQLPGFYRIEELQGDQVVYSATIGVNAGSVSESRTTPQAAPPVAGPDRDPGSVGPLAQPLDLWPWLVMAGLAVLFIEWLYVLGGFAIFRRARVMG